MIERNERARRRTAAAAFLALALLAWPAGAWAGPRAVADGIEFTFFAPGAGKVNLAGTFNGWNAALNNMALVADYTWRTTVSLANATGVQFKFTANGAWISNWGETNQSDFDLPLAGNFAEMGNFPNIRINGTVNGTLRVTFNELTSSYTAELL